MFRKRLILIMFLSLLNCDYTPIYRGLGDLDLQIKLENIDGDRDLNNYIQANIKNYINNNSVNNFTINMESKFEKNTILKDGAGKTTDYELRATVIFNVSSEKINKQLVIKESIQVKKIDNSYDENNYDKNIKRNFSNLIAKKLILRLSQIK